VDWTTLGTTLGSVLVSDFFVAFVSLKAAKWQINSAKEQLDKQIQSERDKELRERRQEIKGQPLRRLQNELSNAAAKQALLFAMFAAQNPVEYQQAYEDLRNYKKNGEFMKTLYLLDDKEIIDRVDNILEVWSTYPADPLEADKLIAQMTEKIRQVQSLIYERLLGM